MQKNGQIKYYLINQTGAYAPTFKEFNMVELRDFNGKLIRINKFKSKVSGEDFILITTADGSIILDAENCKEFQNAINKELENDWL